MGLMDKVAGAAKGKGQQLKSGVSKAAQVAKDRLPDKHDRKIDAAADRAVDGVDRIDPPTR